VCVIVRAIGFCFFSNGEVNGASARTRFVPRPDLFARTVLSIDKNSPPHVVPWLCCRRLIATAAFCPGLCGLRLRFSLCHSITFVSTYRVVVRDFPSTKEMSGVGFVSELSRGISITSTGTQRLLRSMETEIN